MDAISVHTTRDPERREGKRNLQASCPSPIENISRSRGLIIAKIAIAGASKRIIAAASSHFGPRTTDTIGKKSACKGDGQRQSQEQREALQEMALEANRPGVWTMPKTPPERPPNSVVLLAY